jgi:hypothetical protein
MPERLPLRILPFREDSYDWDRFESFCLATVRALPEVKRAARYGNTGERQLGIDIEADLIDGRKRTIQCRHRKQFSKRQAEKTIADTQYVADEHEIWVTCNVGTTVSELIGGLEGWLIESAEGISQKLRLEIPREKARLIVADAFGARVSRAFLGPDTPLAFVAPDDYFAPFDDPDLLLRQDLRLVGRVSELEGLVDAALAPSVRVVVLAGRGGIGKTRLLRAAADALSEAGKRTLFTLDGGVLTPEVLEDLPLEDTIVFVDDAHRGDIALALLLAATRRRDPLTVVLATRPGGLDQIAAACTNAQLEPQQIAQLPRLGALSRDEAQSLAVEALGERSTRAENLADATQELPLITVLGGGLLSRGAFSPGADQGAEELRRSVMSRFVEEQRGRITPRVSEDQAEVLLTLLAALSPLNTANVPLMRLVADELGVTESRLRRWLGDVQDAGLLLARGDRRRLTPDVLADEVLFEACLDRQRRPTGRAMELWQRYSPHAASELLLNLGEVDWRATTSGSSVLDEVWQEISYAFARSDAWGREQLIDLLAPAAHFVPTQILELVDLALATPAATTDWSPFSLQIDDDSVRMKLSVLLGAVGRHRDHARAAMDRLWILGRDTAGATHSFSAHPLDVIRELAGYDFGATHHQALIDLVAHEAAAPEVDEHGVSPLGLLDALLARDGTWTKWVGAHVQIGKHFVPTEATEQWRTQVRDLLIEQALRGTPRQRVSAAAMFDGALRLPYGAPAPEEIRAEWRTDQLRLIDAVARIARASEDPAVRAQLARALPFHAEHGPWDELRQRAAELLVVLSGEEEELLTAIAAPWDILEEEKKTERDERVAALLTSRCGDGQALAQYLEGLVADIVARGMSDGPSVDSLVFHVLQGLPSYAEGLWEWSVAHPDGQVASIGAMALGTLRTAGNDVQARLERAAHSDQPSVRRLAASYLCAGTWFEHPHTGEIALLAELSHDDDPRVRSLISTTLLRLQRQAPGLVLEHALRARVEPDDERSADMLFSTMVKFGIERLDDRQVERLVAQLETVREPGHFAHQAIAALGARDPARVVDLWLARLRREREAGADGYRAVPFHDYGVEMLGGARGQARVALHARLLEPLGEIPDWRRHELGRLFWRLTLPALSDDKPDDERVAARRAELQAAWKAVCDFAAGSRADRRALVDVLSEAPWQVVLSSPTEVAALVELESPLRSDDRAGLENALRTAAATGMHSRTGWEDSPRWTTTAEQARTAAAALRPGSPGARFYLRVEEMAIRELDTDRGKDDEERQGWH